MYSKLSVLATTYQLPNKCTFNTLISYLTDAQFNTHNRYACDIHRFMKPNCQKELKVILIYIVMLAVRITTSIQYLTLRKKYKKKIQEKNTSTNQKGSN